MTHCSSSSQSSDFFNLSLTISSTGRALIITSIATRPKGYRTFAKALEEAIDALMNTTISFLLRSMTGSTGSITPLNYLFQLPISK